jgi:hypothetical protein
MTDLEIFLLIIIGIMLAFFLIQAEENSRLRRRVDKLNEEFKHYTRALGYKSPKPRRRTKLRPEDLDEE